MKYCPNCNANIEGLTHHCDCCGTLLTTSNDLFLWHIFVTAAAGDVPKYVKGIFEKMNDVASTHKETVPQIMFNFFCYPNEMVHSLGIKESMYYFRSKNSISIKLIIDYEQYINSTQSEKKCIIANKIKEAILLLRHRFKKTHIYLDNLWSVIETAIG